MKARNLIILILDSLRADYARLCSVDSVETGNLAELGRYAPLRPAARCGSFPTGPMRTDLLTGSLAFLRGEWALPRPGEATLVSHCREAGFSTCLVTDNYVTVIPRIGGLFIDLFESIDFIRGAAADPWTVPDADVLRSCREREWSFPTRSADFEAQFRTNAVRSSETGKSHIAQVFQAAARQLDLLKGHDRFLLWVDSFACHEPWVSFGDAAQLALPAETPFFPGYVSSQHFLPEHLSMLRAQYVRRIGETSAAMGDFVSAVGNAVRTGDTALVVLSDHGFLFGEYGFVGKSAETPLPPQLHEIVCLLSNHFEDHLPSGELGLQPHLIHSAILSLLGLTGSKLRNPGVHIFGRNSPRSDFLAAADLEGLTIIRKANDQLKRSISLPWDQLDESLRLVDHNGEPPSSHTLNALATLITKGQSEWLDCFC